MINNDTRNIIDSSIGSCLPDSVVKNALQGFDPGKGRVILISIGKAAWTMANAAVGFIGDRISSGIVITKYGHAQGDIRGIRIFEAGHPVPDSNTFIATEEVLKLTSDLSEEDTVLFLVSGGGSSLFEYTDCPLEELRKLTSDLLKAGATINEINSVRKHLSRVKGGRFALHVSPAKIYSVILSDVLGDDPSVIASGPASADTSTVKDVETVLEKYGIEVSESIRNILREETPKAVYNAANVIGGGVSQLCCAAIRCCDELGFKTVFLTDRLDTEARYAGEFLSSVALSHAGTDVKTAFIAGGETVVRVKGNGKGGRNQEFALSASLKIAGRNNIVIFALGSDGTDGPTDAAGGCVDGKTRAQIIAKGIDPYESLERNDSYNALAAAESLIFTGPTGTNVNDLYVALVYPES